jgi:hypothetical protein
MSRKFYVLYSLKEFMIPRIYKTKATINKYIEENNKLEYKQFNQEEDAQLFSRKIEEKIEKKFKFKMVDYLQKSQREIEEIKESNLKVISKEDREEKSKEIEWKKVGKSDEGKSREKGKGQEQEDKRIEIN